MRFKRPVVKKSLGLPIGVLCIVAMMAICASPHLLSTLRVVRLHDTKDKNNGTTISGSTTSILPLNPNDAKNQNSGTISGSLLTMTTPLNPEAQLATLKHPRVVEGTKMWVHDPNDCVFISKRLLVSGAWEPHHQQLILNAMTTPESLFVDIGSNIGTYALVLAAAGFKVEAFEPLPYNIELFKKSVLANGLQDKIKLFEVAVADHASEKVCIAPASLGKPKRNKGNGKIVENANEENGGVCVPLVRPDSLVSRCPDALKVDVEGFEASAMRGLGIGTSCNPKLILLEYVSKYCKGDSPFEVMGDKYECRMVSDRGNLTVAFGGPYRNGDYSCTPKE